MPMQRVTEDYDWAKAATLRLTLFGDVRMRRPGIANAFLRRKAAAHETSETTNVSELRRLDSETMHPTQDKFHPFDD